MRHVISLCLAFHVAGMVFGCSSDDDNNQPSASNSGDPSSGSSSDSKPGGGSSNGAPPNGAPSPMREEEEGGGPPQMLFVGRFDTSDPKGPKAAWPGTRIITRFNGTAVSVTLSEFAESWMGGAPSYWEVSIDQGPWSAIAMTADNQPHIFALASELARGPHQVELYKRSETQTGITQFLGFDFHGGKALPPPPRQERRIEVMGDSQSTGFGVEMIDAPGTDCPGEDYSGKYQNFRKAWGNLLGNIFNAEVHGVVYSGKGVVQNVWPTDTDPLIRYYPRANPNPAIQNSSPPLFDLSSWIPDVIVLAQGAMDFNSGVDYGVFRTAYRAFVIDTLRARSPKTHIFMTVLGKGGRDQIPQIGQELINERKAAVGDDKLHVFVANLYTWEEMLGCNGHGTPAFHQRIANELAAEIRAKVGWP
jgi:hypothetical protein